MITLKHRDWELNNIEAIIFDKDGTITDVHLYWGEIIKMRAESIIQENGLPRLYKTILEYKMGYDSSSKKLLPNGPIALVGRNEVIKIINEYLCKNGVKSTEAYIGDLFNYVHKKFTETKLDECIKIIPCVKDFLNNIQNKASLFLLTSDTKVNAIKGMKKLDLIDNFLNIYGKEDSKEDKITGNICNEILNKYKLNPNNVIAIGDTNTDIMMSKNAKIKACIGVATGQVPISKLDTLYRCNNLSEIKVGKE
jgi:phosphoglycolate phosphatase